MEPPRAAQEGKQDTQSDWIQLQEYSGEDVVVKRFRRWTIKASYDSQGRLLQPEQTMSDVNIYRAQHGKTK